MKKQGGKTTFLFVVIMIAGLVLLLYPTVANYWNSKHATKTIMTYTNALSNIEDDESQRMWQAAVEYNYSLLQRENTFTLTPEQRVEYNSLLNVGGTDVMGYIDIEKIGVSLPIYHGTSEGVLQVAVGHLDWTSLPVGGKGTHCVLSGHRGLPSAKLFTDLDELVPGDKFDLIILDNTISYEVDQIRTVLPNEVQNLIIDPDSDYCTLVTCTPYGINTHRILVRGRRIASESKEVHIVAEAVLVDPVIVAPIMAIPLLFLFLIRIILEKPRKKNKKINITTLR